MKDTATPLLTRENPPLPPNPLTQARLALKLNPGQFATKLKVTKAVVQNAEYGFYNSPPKVYAPFLSSVDYENYQLFRRLKRQQTPPWPPSIDTVPKLLHHFDCSPYQLAQRLCVQQAEIYRLLNKKSRQSYIPSNLREAFVHIGLPLEQINAFSAI